MSMFHLIILSIFVIHISAHSAGREIPPIAFKVEESPEQDAAIEELTDLYGLGKRQAKLLYLHRSIPELKKGIDAIGPLDKHKQLTDLFASLHKELNIPLDEKEIKQTELEYDLDNNEEAALILLEKKISAKYDEKKEGRIIDAFVKKALRLMQITPIFLNELNINTTEIRASLPNLFLPYPEVPMEVALKQLEQTDDSTLADKLSVRMNAVKYEANMQGKGGEAYWPSFLNSFQYGVNVINECKLEFISNDTIITFLERPYAKKQVKREVTIDFTRDVIELIILDQKNNKLLINLKKKNVSITRIDFSPPYRYVLNDKKTHRSKSDKFIIENIPTIPLNDINKIYAVIKKIWDRCSSEEKHEFFIK